MVMADGQCVGYKAEVLVENEWLSNGIVFATLKEAEGYASALWRSWLLAKEHRVVSTIATPNYRFIGPGNHDIEKIV